MNTKEITTQLNKLSNINYQAIDNYIDNFIMDDIDWSEMITKKDLLDSAVGSILENLKEYGITSIKQLSKEQKQKIKDIVSDEWESRDTSDEDEW